MSALDSEFVPVYVPRELVGAVYALITESLSMDSSTVASTPASARPSAFDRFRGTTNREPATRQRASVWHADTIVRAYIESGPAMRRVLDLLVRRAGDDVSSDDLASAIGPEATWSNLAGVLGAFGRRVRSRYSQETPFFRSRWDPELSKMVYFMPPEAAQALREHAERVTEERAKALNGT